MDARVAHATPDTAGDPKKATTPFDELWATYPLKLDRSKAKTAYAKLAPDAELHARIVEAATAWGEHYRTSATEKKWWKRLHNWLAEERYLEDVPAVYEDPKEAAIARTKDRRPQISEGGPPECDTAPKAGLTPKTPLGRHVVEIVDTDLTTVRTPQDFYGEATLTVRCRIQGGQHNGREFTHAFIMSCADGELMEAGQLLFRELRTATKVLDPQDTSDFHGKKILAIISRGGNIKYEAAA